MTIFSGRLRKANCIALVVIAMLLLVSLSSQAKVNCLPDDLFFTLEIYEEITASDVQAVDRCIEELKDQGGHISSVINSPGGDVYSALAIGRLLRKNRLRLSVKAPDQCLSSCVLVLAGAVDRSPYGSIGIHRPYSLMTGIIKFEAAQKRYQATRSDVENYLREMNIPTSLFVAMERIPPENMKYLSKEELNEFGLNKRDPVEQEVRDAYEADLRGISKSEFLGRVAEAEQFCNYGPDNVSFEELKKDAARVDACQAAVSWGGDTKCIQKIQFDREDLQRNRRPIG